MSEKAKRYAFLTAGFAVILFANFYIGETPLSTSARRRLGGRRSSQGSAFTTTVGVAFVRRARPGVAESSCRMTCSSAVKRPLRGVGRVDRDPRPVIENPVLSLPFGPKP
jgi:hypothetical protein